MLSAMVYARGRGPLVALGLIGLLGLAGFPWKWAPLRKRLLILALIVGVVLAVLANMPTTLRYRYERILTADPGESIIARIEAYSLALQMFSQHPLLGTGTASYQVFHGRFRYPHNVFLEALAENGILGFIALCGFLLSVAWKSVGANRRSGRRERGLVAGAGLLFGYMLIHSCFSGDLTSRMLLFSAGLATVVGSQPLRKADAGRAYLGGRGQKGSVG